LALFSPWFAAKQADWPNQTLQPGFVFFQTPPESSVMAILKEFLSSGPPPIVFTQGSTAVHNPGDFYKISAIAAKRLGYRAVLLGTMAIDDHSEKDVLALSYVPYSSIFPHAAVNVHQGGSGTTGEALKAGRPMLVVPYGWDQPDNAARLERLGVALQIPRSNYTVESATAALQRILLNTEFFASSAALGRRLSAEDGLQLACDAIERLV
jgi:UDP:flavonoid glycosyltransferase YjiC (YdhE family)